MRRITPPVLPLAPRVVGSRGRVAISVIGSLVSPRIQDNLWCVLNLHLFSIENAPKSLSIWETTLDDLASPALRGKVGMDNPAISGPTYPLVAGLLQHLGEAQGKAYFERLKANGLRVFPTNSVTLRALQYGQIHAAVVQSSAAIGFLHDMPALRIAAPAPATVLPSDLAIGKPVSGALQQQARRFVQWVLSPAGQTAMQQGDADADSNYKPLLEGTAALPSLKLLGAVQPLVLDPAQCGPQEPQVIDWFTAHIAR